MVRAACTAAAAALLAASAWAADVGLLTADVPGAAAAYAWYPFGRHVRLEPEGDEVRDRFELPGWWRSVVVPVRLVTEDGGGDAGPERRVLCVVPERGPGAVLELDREAGSLRLDAGDGGAPLAAAVVTGEGGRMVTLDPGARPWRLAAVTLGRRFTVVLRDAAGGRVALRCAVEGGRLRVEAAGRRAPRPASRPGAVPDGLAASGRGLEFLGGVLRLDAGGLVAAGRLEGAPRSLRVTAAVREPGGVLAATAAGDLIRFGVSPGGEPVARVVARLGRPVVGLALTGGGRLLVGVAGRGVLALEGGRLAASGISVGTRRVTALREFRGTVYVGTDGAGLWRVVGGRAVRARFPEDVVTELAVAGGRLVVTTVGRRWVRRGCDRYEPAGPASVRQEPAVAVTALAVAGDAPLLATADGRLVRAGGGSDGVPDPGVGPPRDLVAAGGALWAGGERGLVRLDGTGAVRVLEVPVRDLEPFRGGVAAATAGGLWWVEGGGNAERWDLEGAAGGGAFTAVAAWRDGLAAAGPGGLWWWPGPGSAQRLGPPLPGMLGEVAALLSDGDGLLVGTSDRGVLRWDGRWLRPLPGLADLHVAPGAMARIGGEVWIGTRDGMVVRVGADGTAERYAVPAATVWGLAGTSGGTVWLATDQGVMTLER